MRRLIYRILLKPFSGWSRAKFFKKAKVLFSQGENCFFQITDFGSEPYLIKIGNNVYIAANVKLITHDIGCYMIKEFLQTKDDLDFVGKIELEDNIFLGAGSKILPNVRICSNVIVGAGSIVTKSIEESGIYAGVPAKKIGEFENYINKIKNFSSKITWGFNRRKEKSLRIMYFWENINEKK